MSDEGTHQAHCCHRHGCKYGHAKCPVLAGEVEQYYPCEQCGDEAEMTAGLLGDELRELTPAELFLELAVASKATGFQSTDPVEFTVLHPDGQAMLTLARMRVRVRDGKVVIEVQEAI